MPLGDINDDLILSILERLRILNERIIRNPASRIHYQAEIARINEYYNIWLERAERAIEADLARSYLSGIKKADRSARVGAMATGISSLANVYVQSQEIPTISAVAAEILSDYPRHYTMYAVFESAVKEGFESTRIPVIRSTADNIRRIGVLASDTAYRQADPHTRRQLSQELMTEFAKSGVTGVARKDGSVMRVDTYSEMLIRSQTLNASRQANLNRLQERGNDLVIISEHFPCSDLCINYQGYVFSISGASEDYPALDDATEPNDEGHLFHWNCRHTLSPYTEGLTQITVPEKTDAENEKMYEAEQRQRGIERNIREWKRREAAALTDVEKDRAKRYVESWQKRQREHIDENKFLRRDYSREQVAI